MNKNHIQTLAAFIVSLFFSLSVVQTVTAQELKTSSLTMATINGVKAPQQCQKLFNETDKLIAEAAKQPGTHHIQVQKMKNKLSNTKQQILQLDLTLQQKSCDKGLVALNNLMLKH